MRGKRAPKRIIKADGKFNRLDLAKLINRLMERGKKSVAQGILYDAFDIISAKTKRDPLEVYDQAIRNVGPSLELKGRRIGGANYQVPILVVGERKTILAHQWIINAARSKKRQTNGNEISRRAHSCC